MLRHRGTKVHEDSVEDLHTADDRDIQDDSMHPLLEPISRQLRERQASFTQPAFEEKCITVRRISVNADTPDQITRVKSISSTLSFSDDPSPDLLPNKERRNSILSISSSIPKHSMTHDVVDMGERRPSVLSLPGGHSLQVRKVSVGGSEAIMRVRGASFSSPLDQSLTRPTSPIARLASKESIRPNGTRPNNVAATRPPKRLAARPDSNVLTHARSPKSDLDFEQNPSVIDVRSPNTADSVGGIFEGWGGFPAKADVTDRRRMSASPPEHGGEDGKSVDHGGMLKAKEDAGVRCVVEAERGIGGPPVIPLPFALREKESGNLGWVW